MLSYAAESTRDGVITVKARPVFANGAPRLAFSIIDTGPGLTADQLSALLALPSDRGSAPTTTLGALAAARKLAIFMGGDIKATRAPGRGSRFTLDVPLRQPHPSAYAPQLVATR